tara:strand:+ start:1218 stop:1577 length:360 start_codon:yes stop_codon:yes gene_type:complete
MEQYKIIPCTNGVGEWEISPIHETFDTRQQAEERLEELKLLKLSNEITEEVTKVLNHSYQSYISQFKDGVSDALLLGKSADVNLTSAYKQGYDFGIYLEKKMSDQEQKYADNGIGGFSE